jgi:hypothetical protein
LAGAAQAVAATKSVVTCDSTGGVVS